MKRLVLFVIYCVLAAGAGCSLSDPDMLEIDGGMDASVEDTGPCDGELPRIHDSEPSFLPGIQYVDGVVVILSKACERPVYAVSPVTMNWDMEWVDRTVVDHATLAPPTGAVDMVTMIPSEEFHGGNKYRLVASFYKQQGDMSVPYSMTEEFALLPPVEQNVPRRVSFEAWAYGRGEFRLIERFVLGVTYATPRFFAAVCWGRDEADRFVPEFLWDQND